MMNVLDTIRFLESEWGKGKVTTSHIAVRCFGSSRIKARLSLKKMETEKVLSSIKHEGCKELHWTIK